MDIEYLKKKIDGFVEKLDEDALNRILENAEKELDKSLEKENNTIKIMTNLSDEIKKRGVVIVNSEYAKVIDKLIAKNESKFKRINKALEYIEKYNDSLPEKWKIEELKDILRGE